MKPIHQTNIRKWVVDMLPTFLRKPLIIAFLICIISPVIRIIDALRSWMMDLEIRTYANGQVCRLEYLLNRFFDPVKKRIKISDVVYRGAIPIAYRDVHHPVYVAGNGKSNPTSPIAASQRRDDKGQHLFVIRIPQGVSEAEVKRVVDKYKLPTKSYTIIYE